MKHSLLLTFLLSCILLQAQVSKRVLFLGNSYTANNNLPLLIKNIANSTGDDIVFDSNLPGGMTLQGHASDPTSIALINQGTWDFVVLQEQSQIPAFPSQYVNANMYPFAAQLNNLITAANPCTETVFYMTWGRKNGDQTLCPGMPPMCTYIEMDNWIRTRYENMATANNGILSPVGALWR